MPKFKFAQLTFVAIAAIAALLYIFLRDQMPSDPYEIALQKYRKEREERLRAPEGWLSVVGLHWLKSGANPIGRGQEPDGTPRISLPTPVPENLGEIILNGSKASLRLHTVEKVLIDGVKATVDQLYELKTDADEKPTKVKVGEIQFFLLNRPNGIGLRVLDPNSETRKNFAGNRWFPPRKDLVIDAEWISEPKPIDIVDVTGARMTEMAPGYAKFQVDGVEQKLYPTPSGNQLFFVFRDQTSGNETYGASRMLYADAPVNGRVLLDFNKAYNPPCAFIRYSTCPLPSPENIMTVAIKAGELKPE